MDIKGYTYGYQAVRGVYNSPAGYESRRLLMETGINWVCLAFSVKQEHFYSTEIKFDYRKNIPDLELISTIKDFHDNNIKVCLKPMIDTEDGVWRALINFPDEAMNGEDYYWKKWFESYTAYLVHYADIAEYTGCEMFCLGCEMLASERKEALWLETIREVKKHYHGLYTYNTNHGKEEKAAWYSELDYLGTSAYYPVAKGAGASLEEMKAEWEKIADHLEEVSKKLNKPILFVEIGCRSAAGCAAMPWDFNHKDFPRSEEEQANFYEAALSVMNKRDWFAGFFWWDWSPTIYNTKEEASTDTGFNTHLKKAEEVVKSWYAK
ncbi:MAG: glycosyl hydrolase [Lachnospiraceae bacterium]|nr:glycosyl hydrolase [Lachnospiraceae bacterium]